MSAPGQFVFTQQFRAWLGDGTFALATNTIKCAAMTSAWTPNMATQSLWADISANEVANGNGYATGGQTLAGQVFTETAGVAKFDANDHSYTGSGAGFVIRYEAFYASGTLNGHVNPLIGYRLLDSAPADVSVGAGNTVNVVEHANGIFTLT